MVMSSKASAARAKALEYLGAEVEDDCGKGASYRYKSLSLRERKGEIYVHLYAMFELGDPALHLVAPVTLYRACADRFGVDAAELSRGRVRPLVAAECKKASEQRTEADPVLESSS